MKPFIFYLFIGLHLCQSMYSQDFDEIELKVREDSISQYVMAKNNLPTSITLKFKSKSQAVKGNTYILNSRDSIYVKRKKFSSKEAYLNYFKENYSTSYHIGDSLSLSPDVDYLYLFPFKRNKKYKVIQSWGGSFSHNSPTSYHAIDFKMNVGEPIHAARGGKVVRSVEKFTENGGRELRNKANVIVIMHDDQTYAYYVHLRHKGALVEVGQNVDQGELIGYSGNVGFSTQPHLHFVVRDGSSKSIPISFLGQKKAKALVKGKKYRRKK